jgi:hypothetical protein
MTERLPTLLAACATACAVSLTIAGPVRAAPCAGFVDVDAASAFCPSVEWVRNRGVTTGCASSLYCPDQAVSRLAMAAFMQRLGTALTPAPIAVQASPGALDLDVATVVCASGDEVLAGYPRLAIADGTVSAVAPGAHTIAATFVVSLDGGASWNAQAVPPMVAGAGANQWSSVAVVGQTPLDAGATVRFALRVSSPAPIAGNDVTDSRCALRVLLFNRDGATSPY